MHTLMFDLAVTPGLRLILLAHLVEKLQDARAVRSHAAMSVKHNCGDGLRVSARHRGRIGGVCAQFRRCDWIPDKHWRDKRQATGG